MTDAVWVRVSAAAATVAPVLATPGFPMAAPTWEAIVAAELTDWRAWTWALELLVTPGEVGRLGDVMVVGLPEQAAKRTGRARKVRFMGGRIISIGTAGSSLFTKRTHRRLR